MERREKEAELERILASRLFRGSERGSSLQTRASPKSASLLRFLVTHALDGKPLSDAIVTREFFDKEPQTFDRGEAIARVHVGILRKKLAEYYVTDGIDDGIEIAVPIGTFVPVFIDRGHVPPDKDLARGFHQIGLEAPENIARAMNHFEAVLRRPNKGDSHAESHAGIAIALCIRTLHELTASPSELLPAAEAEARAALESNPDSWRAHAALGSIHAFRHEWTLSDQEFRKALTIDSAGTRDHAAYGPYLLGRGNYDAARELAKRDEDEYPAEVVFLKRAALLQYAMREFEEAERILADLFKMGEGIWHAHTLAAMLCLATDRAQEALSHMRKIAEHKSIDLWPGLHILCLQRNGLRDESQNLFDGLLKRSATGYMEPLQIALGYLAFGEFALSVEWLGKGADVGDPHMLWLHLWPFLDPLRERHDFRELLRRVGLPLESPLRRRN